MASGCRPCRLRLYPHELSGGMKQRVCIAHGHRARSRSDHRRRGRPRRSTSSPSGRSCRRSRTSRKQIGSGLILIGHDMGLMAQSVDDLAVLKDGELVEHGTVKQIIEKPATPLHQGSDFLGAAGGRRELPQPRTQPAGQSRPKDDSKEPLLRFEGSFQGLWRGHRTAPDVLHLGWRYAADHLDRRAVRIGQIDDGLDHAGLQSAHDRAGPVRRAGHAGHGCGRKP